MPNCWTLRKCFWLVTWAFICWFYFRTWFAFVIKRKILWWVCEKSRRHEHPFWLIAFIRLLPGALNRIQTASRENMVELAFQPIFIFSAVFLKISRRVLFGTTFLKLLRIDIICRAFVASYWTRFGYIASFSFFLVLSMQISYLLFLNRNFGSSLHAFFLKIACPPTRWCLL